MITKFNLNHNGFLLIDRRRSEGPLTRLTGRQCKKISVNQKKVVLLHFNSSDNKTAYYIMAELTEQEQIRRNSLAELKKLGEQECLLNGEPVEAGLDLFGELFGIDCVCCPGRDCESETDKYMPNKSLHYLCAFAARAISSFASRLMIS